jgi:hypothetical protein
MRRILVTALIGALLTSSLRASEEGIFIVRVQTVTLATKQLGADTFGEVKASYSYSPIAKTRKLSNVSMEYDGKKIEVPQSSLAGHPGLIMESARVSSERGYDPAPWLYLSFQLRADKRKRYYIAFTGGQFSKTFLNP